jgi:trehalose synthase
MWTEPGYYPRRPVHETAVPPRPTARLLSVVGDGDVDRFRAALARAGTALGSGTLWHINSTAEGGGVAELLRANLGYLAGDGLRVRWAVFEGDPRFFQITKRIHNRLHGDAGDGGELGDAERAHVEEVTRRNAGQLAAVIRPGDVVVVHDPQPAGLIPDLVASGARVVWTCHIGVDSPNDVTRSAWAFLLTSVEPASAYVFTRHSYVWEGLDRRKVALIPPCVDPLALKNIELTPAQQGSIMSITGLVAARSNGDVSFERPNGARVAVTHPADVLEVVRVPAGAPIVTQVSRWDRLKDPIGVLRGFAGEPSIGDAHLILAGPSPSSVADDPEAEGVLSELRDAWNDQPMHVRERIHLANLPTDDVDENAVTVNALQRRADVVVQKSLAEGFGLTVTEAMWKRRPLVAGAVGGVLEQIDDGVQGVLVDPSDLGAFGAAVGDLLADPARAAALGGAAHERVRERFLPPHYLAANLEIVAAVASGGVSSP